MREDWKEEELIQVTNFIDYRGRTPKKTERGIKLITAKNVRMGYLKNDPEEFIAESAYDDWMTRGIPKKGDVLFTTEAPLANVALLNTDEKIALAQRIITLCPNREILNGEFLTYCLQSPQMQFKILEKGTGATVTGIKSRVLKKVKVPIPPLPEQKRIVVILDEAFEAIDKAKANVERNIENAEELFQSKLNEIFSQSGEGWDEVKLGKICGYQNGFAFKSKTYKDSGTPLVRIGDIQDGEIDLSNIKYVDREDYAKDLSRYEIIKGDLLIAMSGATTGKVGIVNKDDTFLLNQRVGKFEPREHLNKDFLYYFLSTKVEEALNISAGSAQPNLSTKQIKDFLIPLPSIKVQKALVHELNELSDRVESIIEFYTTKTIGLEELKKAILQKAFSGELTANEHVAA